MKAVTVDRILLFCAAGLLAAIVFAPLFIVRSYTDVVHPHSHQSAEATAGVAVIMRAAVRRVLRTGARNLFQTTTGMLTRTTTRAMTRRAVRVGVKSLTVAAKEAMRGEGAIQDAAQPPWLALLLGFVGLTLSLGWILYALTPDAREAILGTEPMLQASLLGALPMFLFGGLIWMATKWFGVQARFRTGWDGLLLQGYFTGAGSYLPLTTDVEYEGDASSTAKVAGVVLGGLLVVHLALAAVAEYFGASTLEFVSSMILIFAMVYSFPLRPLDGYYLWRRSKLLWFAIWLPIMVCFVMNIPEAYNVIL